MRGFKYKKFKLIFLILLLSYTTLLLAQISGQILYKSFPGNDNMPQLNVIIVFTFSPPFSTFDGKYFFSPLVRIYYSQLADLLDFIENINNAKVSIAISSSFLDGINAYIRSATDDFVSGKNITAADLEAFSPPSHKASDILEWNRIWLPESLKDVYNLNNPEDIRKTYKSIASMLLGKLIGLRASKRIDILAMPRYAIPLSFLLEKDMIGIVKSSMEGIEGSFDNVFGNVKGFFPPFLNLSNGLLKILKENDFAYTFSSNNSLLNVSKVEGLTVFPINLELSKMIKSLQSEEDLVEIFSQLHKLQNAGKEVVSIRIDAFSWVFGNKKLIKEFIQLIAKDKYVKFTLPTDILPKRVVSVIRGSEFGNLEEWFSRSSSRKFWRIFSEVYDSYSRSVGYISNEKKKEIQELMPALLDENFVINTATSTILSGKLIEIYKKYLKKVMNQIGMETFAEIEESISSNIVFLERLNTNEFRLNGLDDEGFWNYSKVFKGEGFVKIVKIVLLKDYLGIHASFSESAKNLIGKSYIVNFVVNSNKYSIYLKNFENETWVFKQLDGYWILSGVIQGNIELQESLEIYIECGKFDDLKFNMYIVDSRRHVKIWSITKENTIMITSK